MDDSIVTGRAPTPREAFVVWLRIGLLSFGGPAAQIALMHREIVEQRRWLSERQYLNALSFCMLLPGPEAMQLATYAGWRLHGTMGGLIAGLSFVLPGALVILGLASAYVFYGNLPLVNAMFLGVKAAVIVIVVEALLRVSRKALVGAGDWLVAALAFVAIFFLALPFPLIILFAALYGFLRTSAREPARETVLLRVSPFASLRTALTWGLIWALPMLLLLLVDGHDLLYQIGLFFSRLAVVTFGGAYAVLAYLGQDVVVDYGWLSAGEMMDGLGLAETTPGPLILVTEFVGFIAAFLDGGLVYGIAGAVITLWVTFTPCFLWIFVGAPYLDWIGSQARLRGALAAITAAVVGVILNLSIWFALHVFFAEVSLRRAGPLVLWQPELSSLDWRVVVLTLLCGVLLLHRHWGITRVLLTAAAGGVGLSLLAP